MGSGKTTIAKNLALRTHLPLIDLDQYIEEKEQMSINDLFNKKGEIYFRKKEHLYLKECLSLEKPHVISLGGGTPCYANNHLLLQQEDVLSIYLKANVSTLVERLYNEKENRPLLQTIDDLSSYIGQHLFERVYYYNFAQHKISVEDKSVKQICDEILSLT